MRCCINIAYWFLKTSQRTVLVKKSLLQIAFGVGLLVSFSPKVSADWVQTNEPGGGRISALLVKGDTIYAANGDYSANGTFYLKGIFRSANNGASWTKSDSGLNSESFDAVLSFAMSGNTIFAGTNGDGIYLSTNGGTSWTKTDTVPGIPRTTSGLPHAFVSSLAANDSFIFAGTNADYRVTSVFDVGAVFFSTNNGATWTKTKSGFPRYISINSLAIFGNNIFAAGWKWNVSQTCSPCSQPYCIPTCIPLIMSSSAGIFRSSKNDTNWIKSDNGILPTYLHANCLAMNNGKIFAGTGSTDKFGGGVFLSTDTGKSWTAVKPGPTDSIIHCFAVSGSNIFTGTESGGIFLSTDTGKSWTAVNSGLTSIGILYHPVNFLAVNSTYIFAGKDSCVWRRPLSEMITATGNKQIILSQKLIDFNLSASAQTNHSVAISFSLAKSQPVTLKICNISGREIAAPINRNIEAGEHKLSWDTKNLAAGCYTVRMQVGSNVYVKNIPVSR
jgi:hypothetical protein